MKATFYIYKHFNEINYGTSDDKKDMRANMHSIFVALASAELSLFLPRGLRAAEPEVIGTEM